MQEFRITNHAAFMNLQTNYEGCEKENSLFHVGFRKGENECNLA